MRGEIPSSHLERIAGDERKADKPPRPKTRRGFLRDLGKGLAGGVLLAGGFERAAQAAPQQKEQTPEAQSALARDWQSYKQTIANSKVRDNIHFIQERFGQWGQSLTFLARENLQTVDQLMEEERKSRQAGLPGRASGVLQAAVGEYKLFWNARNFDRRVAEEESRTGLDGAFVGFEQIAGQNNQQVRRRLEQQYPRRWLYGNISKFTYRPEEKHQMTFQVGGEALGEGLNGAFYKSGREEVIIYGHTGIEAPENLTRLFSHEIGHHWDWENNNRLPIQERLMFLRQVSEAFAAPDHLKTSYVEETISRENTRLPEEEIRYLQTQEYWATLVEQYDTNSENFRKYNPGQFALVERWRERLIAEPVGK